MDAQIMDMQRVIADLKDIESQYGVFASMPFAPPDDAAQGFNDRVTDVFGFNLIADNLLAGAIAHDVESSAQGRELLRILIDAAECRNAAEWLFHILHAVQQSVPSLVRFAGENDFDDGEDNSELADDDARLDYVHEMSRMAATLLLRYGTDATIATQLAYDLLTGDLATVLNILGPMAGVRYDAETAQRWIDDSNDRRLRQWLEDVRTGQTEVRTTKKVE